MPATYFWLKKIQVIESIGKLGHFGDFIAIKNIRIRTNIGHTALL
jgi:hypothetical protein